MAEVNQIESADLGKLVKVDFATRVRWQLSKRTKDFDNFLKAFDTGDLGGKRYHEFALQTSGGPNSVQHATADGRAGTSYDAFPDGQGSDIGWYNAYYKTTEVTIEVGLEEWSKAMDDPDKYAEPLMLESKSKALEAKKEMCVTMYQDGTGVRMIVTGTPTISSGRLVVAGSTASGDTGHAGWVQIGELVSVIADTTTKAVTASTPTSLACTVSSGTVDYYKVYARDLRANTLTLIPLTSAGAVLTATAAGNVVTTNVIYKKGQKTIVATDSAITDDYNNITEVGAGLQSLVQDDDRKVHGVTMGGSTAATIYTATGGFDPEHIQNGLTDVKTATGDEYVYSQILMAPKIKDVFVANCEADRRFLAAERKDRGGKSYYYLHDNDAAEIVSSEYCPNNRIYALPEGRGGSDEDGGSPCEFRGKDYYMISTGGSDEYLKPSSSGGFVKAIQKFMKNRYCFLIKHNASVLAIKGFDQPS